MADDRQTSDDDLDRRIADAKAAHERGDAAPGSGAAEGRAENRGWAVGIEFVGTALASAFIGWLLDRWLGTAPWLLILLLLLGFAAGLRRAMVTSKQFDTNLSNDR